MRARAKAFDFAAVGDGLRLPAMRGSIHLLPRETAHLPFRALQSARSVEAGRMRYFKVTPEQYEELRARVLEHTDEPRSAAELKQLAGGDDALRYVLGAMGREGLLVRVGAEGLRSNALRYVRPRPPIPEADPAEALAWLAGEYLRAYGPARLEDFAWWAGVKPAPARAALSVHATLDLGDGLLLRAEDEAAFERAPAPRGVDLLPKWDMLTMGYPKGGRARFAHDDVAERCYDFRGDGNALILRDGQAVAAWSLRFAGKRMEVEVDWFERPGPRAAKPISAAFEELAALLGATSVAGHD